MGTPSYLEDLTLGSGVYPDLAGSLLLERMKLVEVLLVLAVVGLLFTILLAGAGDFGGMLFARFAGLAVMECLSGLGEDCTRLYTEDAGFAVDAGLAEVVPDDKPDLVLSRIDPVLIKFVFSGDVRLSRNDRVLENGLFSVPAAGCFLSAPVLFLFSVTLNCLLSSFGAIETLLSGVLTIFLLFIKGVVGVTVLGVLLAFSMLRVSFLVKVFCSVYERL